mmetsp:Transcript_31233/g.38583  ORF Transcript_31233/g.38583 Transcript_31233/m.38583 type:complete len:178 (+) Transcript_31233:479-1012(+)
MPTMLITLQKIGMSSDGLHSLEDVNAFKANSIINLLNLLPDKSQTSSTKVDSTITQPAKIVTGSDISKHAGQVSPKGFVALQTGYGRFGNQIQETALMLEVGILLNRTVILPESIGKGYDAMKLQVMVPESSFRVAINIGEFNTTDPKKCKDAVFLETLRKLYRPMEKTIKMFLHQR